MFLNANNTNGKLNLKKSCSWLDWKTNYVCVLKFERIASVWLFAMLRFDWLFIEFVV